VVADGASALYGSDAVAGVANILLKRDYQGLETSANIGASTDGGNFRQQYGAVAGRKWASGGFVAAYEYASNTNIMSNSRAYAVSRPGVIIFPAMRHHAAALSGHQSLTDTLTLEVDALFNKRWSLGGYATNNAGDWSLSHADTLDQSFGRHRTIAEMGSAPWLAPVAGRGLWHRDGDALQWHLHRRQSHIFGLGLLLQHRQFGRIGRGWSAVHAAGGACKTRDGRGLSL
jgi:hypothetical protein